MSKRILIVDDNTGLTTLLRLVLENGFHATVHEVNDSRKAVATARDVDPHLILLDLEMPKLDGGDVLAALRQIDETREIPVIIVTSLVRGTEDHKIQGSQCLAKPIGVEKLLSAMRDHGVDLLPK